MNKGIEREIFLKKGKLRREVLARLTEPKTASEVARELGKHRSAVSRVLLQLEAQGLAKCINPQDDKFRHYVRKN